jgi:hypothetical protein
MSKNKKSFIKVAVRNVGLESKQILEAALKSGANHIGKQLTAAEIDVNQPSDVVLDKLLNALKSGALAAGQEVMMAGLNRVNSIHTPNVTAETPDKGEEDSN